MLLVNNALKCIIGELSTTNKDKRLFIEIVFYLCQINTDLLPCVNLRHSCKVAYSTTIIVFPLIQYTGTEALGTDRGKASDD